MNKEQQIEELTAVIANMPNSVDCIVDEAEYLYNAGYRKQKEGEWIRRYSKHTDHLGTFQKYDGDFCSVCGELGYGKFCYNCGAKMKGITTQNLKGAKK